MSRSQELMRAHDVHRSLHEHEQEIDHPGRARWLAVHAAAAAAALAVSACTVGQVADATTGELIQGATLKFEHLDLSITEGFTTSPATFTAFSQTVHSGAPVPSTSFNYWLDPYAPENPDDTTDTFVPGGWVRVTVSAAGHETLRTYRNHLYTQDQVQTDVPYSAGPYPIPSSFHVQSGFASVEDFSLNPTSAHPLWPDLIVDVRSLAGHDIGVQFPGLLCPSSRCLVFGLNIANVANGPFELTSSTASPTIITQTITQSSGPPVNVAISGGSMIFVTDDGWHVDRLARISLRGPIVSGVCDTEPTADACPAVITKFKQICLAGTAGIFDAAYGGTLAQQAPLTCWANGVPAPISGVLHTGLARGFAEFYSIGNSENFLDVASLASGAYWLEAEVNPDGTYQEADRSNNIARVQVNL